MSKTRSIDEIRRSIASLVAEAEAALSVASSEPAQARPTPQARAAPQARPAPQTSQTPQTPQNHQPQPSQPAHAPMVDLSGTDEDLPPAEPHSSLQETARPLIEKWIAEELPRLAEQLVRARLDETRRD